jgi:hypothetical protein
MVAADGGGQMASQSFEVYQGFILFVKFGGNHPRRR